MFSGRRRRLALSKPPQRISLRRNRRIAGVFGSCVGTLCRYPTAPVASVVGDPRPGNPIAAVSTAHNLVKIMLVSAIVRWIGAATVAIALLQTLPVAADEPTPAPAANPPATRPPPAVPAAADPTAAALEAPAPAVPAAAVPAPAAATPTAVSASPTPADSDPVGAVSPAAAPAGPAPVAAVSKTAAASTATAKGGSGALAALAPGAGSPFAGSTLTLRNTATAVSLNKDFDPTYNPYYALQLTLAPNVHLPAGI